MNPGTNRTDRRSMLRAGFGMTAAILASATCTTRAHQEPISAQATPAESLSTDAFPLSSLLTMVPKVRIEATPYWSYADFERQLASVGATQDESGPDLVPSDAVSVTLALLPGSGAFQMGITLDADEEAGAFVDAIGFRPMATKQHLGFGAVPDFISLFRGDFNAETLVSAWEQAGYVAAEVTGDIPAWTIGPEGEIDMEHPIQRIVTAEMNNVAIVGDVLLYTNNLTTLNELLEHIAHGTPSVMDDDLLGPVVQSLPISTVSAMGMPPITGLPATDAPNEKHLELLQEELDAVRAEVGPMPTVTAMVLAVEEGALATNSGEVLSATPESGLPSDAGTMLVRMGTETPEDAEQAAKVVAARAASLPSLLRGDPLSELIVPKAQGADGTTAMVDFTQLNSPHLWYQMVLSSDVLLFVPDELT